MDKNKLIEILNKHIKTKAEKIVFYMERIQNIKFTKLRDSVYFLNGNILEEDLENHIYVASIKGGMFNSNYAYVVMQLENDELSVAIYAVEGLINQHTSENVLEKLLYTLKDQYEKEK